MLSDPSSSSSEPEGAGGGSAQCGVGGDSGVPVREALLECCGAALFALDRSYRYLAFNRAHSAFLKQLTGRDPAVGVSLAEYLPADDWKQVRRSVDRALGGTASVAVVDLAGRSGDTRVFLEVDHRPLRADDGSVYGVALSVRELTRREGVERGFREPGSVFHLLAEIAPLGIGISDAAENTLYLNPRFTELFGYTLDDIPTLREWWPKAYPDPALRRKARSRWSAAMQNPAATREPFPTLELPVTCADGTVRQVEFRTASMGSLNVVFLNDISERVKSESVQRALTRRLERSRQTQAETLREKTRLISELNRSMESLEETNAVKNKLFSIIAHDLRSPFSAFLNLLGSLREEFPALDPAEVREYLDLLQSSASGAYELLENLLEWAALQEGSITVRAAVCEVGPAVARNIGVCGGAAARKSIHMVNRCAEGMHVSADPQMLDTVLRNLIGNAVKFTHEGGRVEVFAAPAPEAGEFIEIGVRDTGIGIPGELREHIFSLDRKTGRPGTHGEVSSGLGLALCKDFVELHKGRISVESETGAGATFRFTLPAGHAPPTAAR
ncbi:MAG: PAS domain-containing sensor histidine kinase [Opitutales bacterium]|nr:PAS domain-containing sensor histidine kinase [Opitutales bacterium]